MDRRQFLKTATAVPAAAVAAQWPLGAMAAAEGGNAWRMFEVTSRVEILKPSGVTKIWLPVPLLADRDFHKSLGNTWSAPGGEVRYTSDAKYSMGMVAAELPASVEKPTLTLVSRFATRDRAVDISKPSGAPAEDPAVLKLNLQPTELIPTDGIVRETARDIIKNVKGGDLEKSRAIYEWVVDNTFRDAKVRGCGWGDIKSMLETRNFGGKCGDLNAMFVGLNRSVGIPARDVYGIRVVKSNHGYMSLGANAEVISRAQHCRAEFYVQGYGWIPADPADVRKVVLEEPPGNLAVNDPKVERMRKMLFGAWEMNWLAYSYAHDVVLPGSKGPKLPYFMYPNGETAEGRLDSLDPDAFKYHLTARELKLGVMCCTRLQWREPPQAGGVNVLWLARYILTLVYLAAAAAVFSAELKPAGGAVAQPLVLKMLDGSVHDLAQYRGQVVLVNFWATWCEPCRDEMPSLQRLKEKLEKFSGQPFAVLAVNVDEPEARVRLFLEKMPLQLTVLLDPGKQVTKAWNARILPASYVIGRDGRVRYSVVGEIDWSDARVVKMIAELLRSR